MKLIDKEKLLEDLKQKRYSKRSLELIQKQPEIEALPYQWIEDYADKYVGQEFAVITAMLFDWRTEKYEEDDEKYS